MPPTAPLLLRPWYVLILPIWTNHGEDLLKWTEWTRHSRCWPCRTPAALSVYLTGHCAYQLTYTSMLMLDLPSLWCQNESKTAGSNPPYKRHQCRNRKATPIIRRQKYERRFCRFVHHHVCQVFVVVRRSLDVDLQSMGSLHVGR